MVSSTSGTASGRSHGAATVISKGGGGGSPVRERLSGLPCSAKPEELSLSSSFRDTPSKATLCILTGTSVIASSLALTSAIVSDGGAATWRVGPKAACIDRGSATRTKAGGALVLATLIKSVSPLLIPA